MNKDNNSNLGKIIGSVIVGILVVVFSFFSKDYLTENSTTNNNPIEQTITQESKIELQEAYVTKVIDGDTLWVDIDGKSYKVRFVGINCPEYTKEIEPYGKEATEYTNNALYHKTVYLQKDITDADSYDRLLRYVWTEKITEVNGDTIDKYLFNAELVKVGLAQSNYYKPNITLQEYLETYENQAKKNKKGMWQ